MGIKVSRFFKKKINKSELKEIIKISNIIEEYLNQKEMFVKKLRIFFMRKTTLILIVQ
mgnify:CR=1 FL=1